MNIGRASEHSSSPRWSATTCAEKHNARSFAASPVGLLIKKTKPQGLDIELRRSEIL